MKNDRLINEKKDELLKVYHDFNYAVGGTYMVNSTEWQAAQHKRWTRIIELESELSALEQEPEEQPATGIGREELLFNSLSDFVFKTFPDASSNDHLKKLKIEADEAMQDNRDSSEYADCLMAVYGAAAKAGFSFDELIRAGFEKLEINKTRKWERLKDGTYQHI
jgi:hypothetical protein